MPRWDTGRACLIGGIHMVRALGLGGIRCTLVTTPEDPAQRSRHVDGAIHWPDIQGDPDGLLARLLDFAADLPEPPVLYFENDPELLLVSRHRERLGRGFRFAIAEAGLVEALVDKTRFLSLAEGLGLPVPATRRLDLSLPSPPRDLGLAFPIVLKPQTRFAAWDGVGQGGKAVRVETAAGLAALWPGLRDAALDILAQELIPGPESRIESYHCYVDGDGRIAGDFTGVKIRTWPAEFGHSTALTLTDAADVAALGRRCVETLRLRGVAKLDFKRGPDGRLHLLEVNPRFNLWHHLAAAAGLNLPALVQADLTGRPRPAVRPARAGARWCNLGADRKAARAQGLNPVAWALWAVGCDAKSVSFRDPMPSLAGGLGRIAGPRRRRVPAKALP